MVAFIERIVAPQFAVFGKLRRGRSFACSGMPLIWKQRSKDKGKFPAALFTPPASISETAGAYHIEISSRTLGALTGFLREDHFALNLFYLRDFGSASFPEPYALDTTRRCEHSEQITLLFDREVWNVYAAELLPQAVAWMRSAREILFYSDNLTKSPRFVCKKPNPQSGPVDAKIQSVAEHLQSGQSVLAGRNALGEDPTTVISQILCALDGKKPSEIAFSSGYARHDAFFDLQLFADRTLSTKDDNKIGNLRLCGKTTVTWQNSALGQHADNSALLEAMSLLDLQYSAAKNKVEQANIEARFLEVFNENLQRDQLLGFEIWQAIANLLHVPQFISSYFSHAGRRKNALLVEANLKALKAASALEKAEFLSLCQQITPLDNWQENCWPDALNNADLSAYTLSILSRYASSQISLGLNRFEVMKVATALAGSGWQHQLIKITAASKGGLKGQIKNFSRNYAAY